MVQVVVVCGYGCHLVPELRLYLDKVVQFVRKTSPPDAVIFCGGFTQRKTSADSEARVMMDYVVKRSGLEDVDYFLEDNSYTTPENIQRAAAKIREYIDGDTQV